MNIVIFNWRDLRNPRAGGAELVTHEIARRWVGWGHKVTLLTAAFPNSESEEVIDGVHVVRRGGQVSVRWHALRYFFRHLQDKTTVVIDEINTLPFFTPFFVKTKKVAYFNQLAREVWFFESSFPLNLIGYLLEPVYLLPYRRVPTIVISQSTKDDLLRLGFKKVEIFPMAIDFQSEQPFLGEKEKTLTLIFVGRMVKSKRPDQAIRAVDELKRKIPGVKLWLVGGGDGEYLNELKALVKKLGLQDSVEFKGFVTHKEKYTLMAKAHLILVTSIREGWGLIITEANALKTPAVVYDVSGLRDAVKNNETGLVVSPNPTSLADGVERLSEDKKLYTQLQTKAYTWSRELTWEQTAKKSLDLIEKAVEDKWQ